MSDRTNTEQDRYRVHHEVSEAEIQDAWRDVYVPGREEQEERIAQVLQKGGLNEADAAKGAEKLAELGVYVPKVERE